MKNRNANILLICVAVLLLLVGCKPSSGPLVIKAWNINKIKAGQDFNIQPNGSSAIWIGGENFTKSTVIVWGDTRLDTAIADSKQCSAIVPKELYSKPGKYNIYLIDTKDNRKSNIMIFTVE